MPRPVDIVVDQTMAAAPDRVRAIMFDPRRDPDWMAAVKSVEIVDDHGRPGARVRRIGRFLGRTLRWTTEVALTGDNHLHLQIVNGPMCGTVTYRIDLAPTGSKVSIRNIGETPRFAPHWILSWAMRRALTADLRRLQHLVEERP